MTGVQTCALPIYQESPAWWDTDHLLDPDFPKVEWLDVDKLSIKTTPYLVVVLVEIKRGLTPSPGRTPGKLSTAVWVRRAGLTSLDPVGVLTHPRKASGRLRHC